MIRSATSKMSCRLCEIRTTASPCSARRSTSSSTCCVCATPSAAVGSSRMTSARVPHHRAGDRDRLPLAARQGRDRLADRADRRHREALHRLGRLRLHHRLLEPVQPSRAPRGRGTCSGRRRGCRRARGPGRRPRSRACAASFGPWMWTSLAVEEDLAAVRSVDAGDALDQRRLAGAVVADERHHLTGPHLELDVRKRLDRAEALRESRSSRRGVDARRRSSQAGQGRKVGAPRGDGPHRWMRPTCRTSCTVPTQTSVLLQVAVEELLVVRLRDRHGGMM